MRTPRTEPLYRAAVIARWCDVSCSMLQTFCLMNHYTSVVPHVRTCFLNVHTSQIERYIGRVLLSATLGTDLVVFPHGHGYIAPRGCSCRDPSIRHPSHHTRVRDPHFFYAGCGSLHWRFYPSNVTFYIFSLTICSCPRHSPEGHDSPHPPQAQRCSYLVFSHFTF